MGRQSYYELLGLDEQATADEIHSAFKARCANIALMPDDEDRRNQLTFVSHARDVLLDVRERAAHDRALAAGPEGLIGFESAATQRPRRAMMLSLLSIALIGLVTSLKQGPTEPATWSTSADRGRRDAAPEAPKLAHIAALIPPPDADALDTLPTVQPEPSSTSTRLAEPMPINLMVAGTPLFEKIIDATYAIVGTQTMGTGVAIEKDRLLTNCHVLAPNVLKGKIYAISAKTSERFEITQAAFLVKDDACVALVPGLVSQPLTMGETKQLRPGANFHNLGFADGTMTLSEGRYLGNITRSQQTYLVSTNYCVPGISGGALVNDQGQLLGITSGGTPDHRYCASLTAETARTVLNKSMIPIDAFPTDYLTNFRRRW